MLSSWKHIELVVIEATVNNIILQVPEFLESLTPILFYLNELSTTVLLFMMLINETMYLILFYYLIKFPSVKYVFQASITDMQTKHLRY